MGRSLKRKNKNWDGPAKLSVGVRKKMGTVLKKEMQDRPQKVNKKINWRRKNMLICYNKKVNEIRRKKEVI